MCKFSLKYWSCINEKCTFVHLKGTQRRAENIRSNFENIKPSFENNAYVSPTTDAKNDPLSRIEDMIGKLRGDYEKEMNLVRAEFRYFKNESMHYGQQNPHPSEQDKQTFYRTTFLPENQNQSVNYRNLAMNSVQHPRGWQMEPRMHMTSATAANGSAHRSYC